MNTQMNSSVEKEIISTQNENTKKERKFQYKKNGRINKAEEKELRRTCTSLLSWIQTPALPPPPPPAPTMNDAQEETDDMEWEEVGREERLERVRRKKEGWEVARFAKGMVLELAEKAVTIAENKFVSEWLEEIMLEGWRRIETGRALRNNK